MRILMISAEGPPLARATALVDVLEALPRELRARKHEVGIAMPFYREIRENAAFEVRDTGVTVDVRVGAKNYVAEFLEGRTAGGVQTFFVRCDEFFDRAGIYGEHGVPYEDNAARFIFFCKAALELARRMTPTPQILHVHDWAAALVPVLVRDQQLPFATVLTIHHLAEQGSFWGLDFDLTNLPERYFKPRGVEFFGRLNLLKGGILFADKITTVSERYRREMLKLRGRARARYRSARTRASAGGDFEWRRLRTLESGDGWLVAPAVWTRQSGRKSDLPRPAARRAGARARPGGTGFRNGDAARPGKRIRSAHAVARSAALGRCAA